MSRSSSRLQRSLTFGAAVWALLALGPLALAQTPGPAFPPTSLPPSGAAGGDLTGTYPNPTVATLGAISGANLTGLNGSNIASGTVADARIATTLTGKTLTGGTINNTIIGGTTGAAGAFTNVLINGVACTLTYAVSSVILCNNGTIPWMQFANPSSSANNQVFIQYVDNSGVTHFAPANNSLGSSTDAITVTGFAAGSALAFPNAPSATAAQTGTWCRGTSAVVNYDPSLGCLTSLEETKNIQSWLNPFTSLWEASRLAPFWFSYKDGGNPDQRVHAGLGAHQVAGVDTRLAGYGLDGKLRGVRYADSISSLNTSAIQGLLWLMALLACWNLWLTWKLRSKRHG